MAKKKKTKKTVKVKRTVKKSGLKPFAATLKLNSVYRGGKVSGANRYKRREALRNALEEEADKIIAKSRYETRKVGDNEHVNNIEKLRARVTKRCGSILKKGKLRFGTAQKYLNVELKRLWLDEKYSEPPHCPFDRIVINAFWRDIEDGVCISWTKCDSRKCYKAWVKALRNSGLLGRKTIAQWERDYWLKARR